MLRTHVDDVRIEEKLGVWYPGYVRYHFLRSCERHTRLMLALVATPGHVC